MENDLVQVFREALDVIERGYIAVGDGMGEAASRGSRRALAAVQENLRTLDIPLPDNNILLQRGELTEYELVFVVNVFEQIRAKRLNHT